MEKYFSYLSIFQGFFLMTLIFIPTCTTDNLHIILNYIHSLIGTLLILIGFLKLNSIWNITFKVYFYLILILSLLSICVTIIDYKKCGKIWILSEVIVEFIIFIVISFFFLNSKNKT